jgi:hypothetical protein
LKTEGNQFGIQIEKVSENFNFSFAIQLCPTSAFSMIDSRNTDEFICLASSSTSNSFSEIFFLLPWTICCSIEPSKCHEPPENVNEPRFRHGKLTARHFRAKDKQNQWWKSFNLV